MNDFTPKKHCSKCGVEYPATLEYFNKHKTCKYGVTSTCKSCIAEWHREHRNTPEQKLKDNATSKRWYESNKNKKHEQYEVNKLNPEWVEAKRVRSHIYYLTDAYKEKERTRNRTPSRRIYRNVYMIDWRKRPGNDLYSRVMCARRRARVAQSQDHHTKKDIEKQLMSQKNMCWWCGCRLTDDYHIDHRIALSKGGSNSANNICISCPVCNLRKQDKMPWEFNGRLL